MKLKKNLSASAEDRERIKKCAREGRVESLGDFALFYAPDGPAVVTEVSCWGKGQGHSGNAR